MGLQTALAMLSMPRDLGENPATGACRPHAFACCSDHLRLRRRRRRSCLGCSQVLCSSRRELVECVPLGVQPLTQLAGAATPLRLPPSCRGARAGHHGQVWSLPALRSRLACHPQGGCCRSKQASWVALAAWSHFSYGKGVRYWCRAENASDTGAGRTRRFCSPPSGMAPSTF